MFNDGVKGALLAFVNAVLGLSVVFGLNLTAEQVGAIVAAIAAGFFFLQVIFNGSSPLSIRPNIRERARRASNGD